jgi:hypothetical protein
VEIQRVNETEVLRGGKVSWPEGQGQHEIKEVREIKEVEERREGG